MNIDNKDVQLKILKMYKIILPLLEKAEINFVACGGTCLGACRESGFIEWDDDMDINIQPEEWGKFQEMLKELPGDLYHEEEMPGIHKIYHKELKFKGNPVFIDFMKLGYVKKINKVERIIINLLTIHFVCNSNQVKTTRLNHWWIYLPIRVLSFWIPARFTMWLVRRILSSKDKRYISQYRNLRIYKRTINDASVYKNRIKTPFEDTYMYVPKNFDAYLTTNFGNWKTPVNWERDHYK